MGSEQQRARQQEASEQDEQGPQADTRLGMYTHSPQGSLMFLSMHCSTCCAALCCMLCCVALLPCAADDEEREQMRDAHERHGVTGLAQTHRHAYMGDAADIGDGDASHVHDGHVMHMRLPYLWCGAHGVLSRGAVVDVHVAVYECAESSSV